MAVAVSGEVLELIFRPARSARRGRGTKIAVLVMASITAIADAITAGLSLHCSLATMPKVILFVEFAVLVVSRGWTIAFAAAAVYTHPKLVRDMEGMARKAKVIRSVGYEGSRDNELDRATRTGGPTRRSNRSSGGA